MDGVEWEGWIDGESVGERWMGNKMKREMIGSTIESWRERGSKRERCMGNDKWIKNERGGYRERKMDG